MGTKENEFGIEILDSLKMGCGIEVNEIFFFIYFFLKNFQKSENETNIFFTSNGEKRKEQFSFKKNMSELFPTITVEGKFEAITNVEMTNIKEEKNLFALQKVSNICWVLVFSYFVTNARDLADLSLVCKKFDFIINKR